MSATTKAAAESNILYLPLNRYKWPPLNSGLYKFTVTPGYTPDGIWSNDDTREAMMEHLREAIMEHLRDEQSSDEL